MISRAIGVAFRAVLTVDAAYHHLAMQSTDT